MVADVEVGALLSGGLNSSAIVAAMCRATDPSKIMTFCAAVTKLDSGTDNFGDDQNHARIVAGHLGVGLVEVPTDADLTEALPGTVWQLDEPTADFAAVQTLMLAEAARDNGIKCAVRRRWRRSVHRLRTPYSWPDLGHGQRNSGMRSLGAGVLGLFPPSSILGRRLQRIGMLLAMNEDAMLADGMSYSAVGTDRRRELLAPGVRDAMPADGIADEVRHSLDATADIIRWRDSLILSSTASCRITI